MFAPKVDGAWHLHELTEHMDFERLCCSPRLRAPWWPGQANYAAANAFLDALASHRRARGSHGLLAGVGALGRVSGMTGALE